MITYSDSLDGITAERLQGFFVGWPNLPSPAAHRRILAGSDYIELALDGAAGPVVGLVTAVGDGVSCAYIPHLEVLPAFQRRGIGTELMRRMLARLDGLYGIDLLCDPEVQPFYARLGMRPAHGMLIRNFDRQSGSPGRQDEEG